MDKKKYSYCLLTDDNISACLIFQVKQLLMILVKWGSFNHTVFL